MVKGGMMEKRNGKEGEKRWICCFGQRIWYLNCGSMLTWMLQIKQIIILNHYFNQLSACAF